MKFGSRASAIRRSIDCLMVIACWLISVQVMLAQSPQEPLSSPETGLDFATTLEGMRQRLLQLEENQSQLLERTQQLSSQIRDLTLRKQQPALSGSQNETANLPPAPSSDESGEGNETRTLFQAYGRTPDAIFPQQIVDTAMEFPLERPQSGLNSSKGSPAYYVGFDRGFVIRPIDKKESPFELKINSQAQIRYNDFSRDVETWTDSAGNVQPVIDENSFQIPRGRIIYSGFVFKPELSYNLNIDYNTVSNRQINFRAFWLAWRFSRAMTVYAGQSKVPGSREWLASFVNTLGADRSMATTFFRPSLSQGIWATGEPVDGLFYHVMLSNGFNTLGTTANQLNALMSFSGSVWWDPLGDYGAGYSDFEWHAEPAIRVGVSGTYSPEQGPQGSPNLPENSDLRFSDGTLITQTGALAPGVTLNTYKIGLTTFDFAYKQRGFSFSGEIFLQDLFDLGGDGPLPNSSVFQYGGFAQAGYFILPQKLEPYGRFSEVTGPSGTGTEYAGGFNWFFLPGKQNLRFTFDAAWLDHNPADQNRTGYSAGQSGLLVRSQLQIFY